MGRKGSGNVYRQPQYSSGPLKLDHFKFRTSHTHLFTDVDDNDSGDRVLQGGKNAESKQSALEEGGGALTRSTLKASEIK